ncbi:MAG: NCS2 family permease [Clostridia bacterium]|nr:NCS2 family permease [Clostridia bacterium]
MLEKVFKLKANNTTARTEITAGLTTFMTMAYIIALNPNMMTGFDTGSPLWNGVFMSTCIAAGIGMLVMAFYANKPFALGPGMGLNVFFAAVVTNIVAMTGMTYLKGFQATMCIILVEGIIFLLLSVFNVRDKIINAIPLGIRLGISPGVGLMLMNIGLGSNAGVYSETGGPFYVLKDFFGSLTPGFAQTTMGSGYGPMVLNVITMFIGLFLIVILAQKKVKGAMLLGMLISCVFYWICQFVFMGTNPFASLATASFVPPVADWAETTLFKFDFAALLEIGWLTVITLTITFCIIDMFDTIGTVIGAAALGGMLDEKGDMPGMKETLTADAVATILGGATGNCTITTFVESAAGVEAGGRTGLTALVCGILFLACMFIAPIAALIPPAVTSAALIYVGILMVSGLKNLNFNDPCQLIPAALMLITIPISSSIGNAIGIAMIAYTVIKCGTGKAKEVHWLTYLVSAIFLLKFFLIV